MKKSSPLTLLSFLLLTSCSWFGGKAVDGKVVAKYKGETLTIDMVNYHVPQGVSKEDSARYAKLYIDQWIKEKVIADKAEKVIDDLDNKIEYKVEDYRNKLILDEYRDWLLKENPDTLISEEEIRNYYDLHKNKFISPTDLYSYFYVAMANISNADYGKASSLIGSSRNGDISSLMDWCDEKMENGTVRYYKLDSAYTTETEVRNIQQGFFVDLINSGDGKVRQWSGAMTGQNRRYLYMRIDLVQEGEVMPIRLARNKIIDILRNERKIRLIEGKEKGVSCRCQSWQSGQNLLIGNSHFSENKNCKTT